MNYDGIKSVESALHILDKIKSASEPPSLTQLAYETHMSKSQLQKYMNSFLELGVLSIYKKSKVYTLGPKLIELGSHALHQVDILSMIDPFMLKIKNEIHQSSAVTLWTEKGPMISKYQSSGKSINVEIKVGYRPPLLKSSVGRCFAAFFSTEHTKPLMDEEMRNYHLNKEQVLDDLNDIRKLGFSSRGRSIDNLPGDHSISVPIFDPFGEMIAAVSVMGFSDDLNVNPDSDNVKKITRIAREISDQFAYKDNEGG